MPLADQYPVIDDRRYADLVAEARTRIPRYAPEWNDLNDNEPGMAVVQVLGWYTELLVRRLAQVPKLNYLKFLELIGIELNPAQPAAVEITFPVVPTFTDATVIVPLHTQVAAEIPGVATPIVFETERALITLQARLASVQLDSGFEIIDASAANDDAQSGFACFGQTARLGASLMLGFDSLLDFPSVALDLMVWVKLARTRGPVYADCTAAPIPPAGIAWEYWNGAEWQPLDLLKDETVAFTRSGHVTLLLPAPNATTGPLQRAVLGQVTQLRYWIRARLNDGAYQTAPQLLAIRTNTVPALQAQTVDAEALGRATGLDDQVFTLANKPVLTGTLQLTIDEGQGAEPWEERPDFFASGPDDRHYVLNRSTGEIRFGRGKQLRVPIANPNNPINVVAQTYRFGGGASGNVGAGLITNVRGNVAGIDAGAVANLFPAYGGSDEEMLDAARDRAAQTLKSHDRAVTAEDFELHAKAAANVARAKALPLFHPLFEGVEVPGVVSVIVVPFTAQPDPLSDPAPMPTEGTLRAVCAYLNTRRLATVELYTLAPKYSEISVKATLVCRSTADLAEVKQQALTALATYFHPLVGGDDGTGWPFGGDIVYSALLQQLMLAGVRRVNAVEMTLDRDVQPACTDVLIAAHALLKSGTHQITVQYEVTS
jgi:predicted phage baseplate assembly protein